MRSCTGLNIRRSSVLNVLGEVVARRAIIACWLCVGMFGVGCAQGYSSEAANEILAPSDVPPPPPIFLGEACSPLGSRMPCMCSNGFEMGLRACATALDSPTKAALSGCLPCELPPPSVAGMGSQAGTVATAGASGARGGAGAAAIGGAAGHAGSSGLGAGGSSGAAGRAGPGRGGTGGSTAGGTGRPRPSAPTGPPSIGPGCECGQSCFPFGIIACCLPEGGCGCTWAPGAYCF
jgi:hypothetical protein